MKSISCALLGVFSFALEAQEVPEWVLPTIEVTATRQEKALSSSLSDVSVINQEGILRKGAVSAVDLLNQESGVQTTSSGPRGTAQSLFLRGTNSNHTLILLDGVPLNSSVDLSGSLLRFLSPFDIARVEILKGNASSLYGANAVGGVVHFISRPIEEGFSTRGLLGWGSENTHQLAADLSGGNALLRGKFSIQNEGTSGFSAQRYAKGKDADKDGFYNTGVSAAFSILPFEGFEMGARLHHQEGAARYDSGSFPPNGNFDDRGTFQNSIGQIYARHENAFWKSLVRLSGSLDQQRNFNAYSPEGDLLQSNRALFSWQNNLNLPLGEFLALLEFQKEQGKFKTARDIASPRNVAGVLGWNGEWGKHAWQLNARLDDHSVYKQHTTFNAAYAYTFFPNWRFRLGYGTAFRAPSLYELYLENPSWFWVANPDLKPEKSKNVEAALLWEKENNRFSLTVFQQRINDLIGYASDPITFISSNQNIARAKIKGASLSWNGEYASWKSFFNYDFLNAKDQKTKKFLGRRAQHSFKTGAAYDFGLFLLGSELFLMGKRFDDHLEKNKLAGFGLLNVFGEYRFSKKTKFNLRVNNVLDKRYELALAGVFSSKRYPYNAPGLNAFLSVQVEY